MISVVVSNVTFDPKSRRCLNCKMFYDVNSGKCPRCERPYECLEPCWDARLRLAESETDSVYRGFMNVVRLSGPAMDVIMGTYQAINPKVETLWQALWIFNAPFTFIKGLLSVVITFLIYKRISPLIKGR